MSRAARKMRERENAPSAPPSAGPPSRPDEAVRTTPSAPAPDAMSAVPTGDGTSAADAAREQPRQPTGTDAPATMADILALMDRGNRLDEEVRRLQAAIVPPSAEQIAAAVLPQVREALAGLEQRIDRLDEASGDLRSRIEAVKTTAPSSSSEPAPAAPAPDLDALAEAVAGRLAASVNRTREEAVRDAEARAVVAEKRAEKRLREAREIERRIGRSLEAYGKLPSRAADAGRLLAATVPMLVALVTVTGVLRATVGRALGAEQLLPWIWGRMAAADGALATVGWGAAGLAAVAATLGLVVGVGRLLYAWYSGWR